MKAQAKQKIFGALTIIFSLIFAAATGEGTFLFFTVPIGILALFLKKRIINVYDGSEKDVYIVNDEKELKELLEELKKQQIK